MNEERKAEIALALGRYHLHQKQSNNRYFAPGTDFFEELNRLFEAAARGTQIPKEELAEYGIELLREAGMLEE